MDILIQKFIERLQYPINFGQGNTSLSESGIFINSANNISFSFPIGWIGFIISFFVMYYLLNVLFHDKKQGNIIFISSLGFMILLWILL